MKVGMKTFAFLTSHRALSRDGRGRQCEDRQWSDPNYRPRPGPDDAIRDRDGYSGQRRYVGD